jgi:hypothetical protein
MTLLWLCVLWVFASAIVAMLPMRRQYFPGIALLLAAPVLIVMVGLQTHWAAGVFALFAFVSMFRNPLRYIWAKVTGKNPEIPQ